MSLEHETPAEHKKTSDHGDDFVIAEQLTPALEEPSFLHPSSILFEGVSHVRQYIVPTIFAVVGAARGSLWWAGFALIGFGFGLAFTLVRYFTLRYQIDGSEFVVTEGLLFRRVRSVPLRRIQNMDLVQNVLHRIFGVAEVNIETASGTKPEATLRVLTMQQIAELRSAVFNQPALVAEAGAQTDTASSDAAALPQSQGGGEPIYRIPVQQLVLAGLASNRGTVLLGIIVGSVFQSDTLQSRSTEYLERFRFETSSPFETATWIVGLVLLAALVLRLLSIAWYLLRFHGYELKRYGEDLRISCGLFTKISATVPRRRIQFISVHRPFLMRKLGLASIRIETAGGAGSENENATSTVSRRWFLPVLREDSVDQIVNTLRPRMNWQTGSDDVQWHGVSASTGKRLLRVSALLSILVSIAGLLVTRPWGWLAGPVVFPALAALAVRKSRARRYARLEWGVAYQSGLLGKKLSFAFYDRIQTLSVAQSPFDSRWQMARLEIDTAAAGPAEHQIVVSYLDEQFAFDQFDSLHQTTAIHRPSWA